MKKTKLLLYICLAMFLLNSCTEEKEYLENNNRDLKLSRKPFKELLSLKDFNSAYQKVKSEKQRSIASRSEIEDEYNFTIVEGKDVKIVEVDNKTFYNILIQRDVKSAAYFENLLLMVEKNNNIDDVSAYIVKYEVPDTTILINPSTIDKDITTLFGRYTQTCYTACTPICITPWGDGSGAGGHMMLNGCTFHHLECTEICFNDPLGGGGLGTGSGGGGGGEGAGTPPTDTTPPPPSGANGGATPPELLIDPVFEEEIEEEEKTPCELLNEMNNLPIIFTDPAKTVLTNLNDLKSNVNIHRERVYVMMPIYYGGNYHHNALGESFSHSELETDGVSINVGTVPIDIIAHSHWSIANHLSTFSLEDIYQIYKSVKKGNITNSNDNYFTSMVVTAHGTQYALKFKSLNAFKIWGETFFDGWEYPILSLRNASISNAIEKTYSEYDIGLGNTNERISKNELGLAKFLKDQGAGLELYKVNDDFSQWTKLNVSSNGNNIEQTPCNN